MSSVVSRVDEVQRRHAILGFPYAVCKRYGEDHGGWLGSLISYYGFFSLYPLLVVFVTVATWIFGDRPRALQSVLEAMWSKVPFATADLAAEVDEHVVAFQGQAWVLVLSLIVTLWGGIGVVRVLQDTVNTIWGVPRYRRPRLLVESGPRDGDHRAARTRDHRHGGRGRRHARPRPPDPRRGDHCRGEHRPRCRDRHRRVPPRDRRARSPRELLPGAIITGVGAYAITLVSGLYVKHVIARMTGIYGPFASTIGLLAYVSLIVQVFVFGTEVNVVRAQRLWPRAMAPELGPADQRAIELTMRREALADPTADGST